MPALTKMNDQDAANCLIGSVVVSLKGHDSGKSYVVISCLSKDFCLVSDGDVKPLDKPKLKRVKHVKQLLSNGVISPSDNLTNEKIKNFLKQVKTAVKVQVE